jgi:hypothetical protein
MPSLKSNYLIKICRQNRAKYHKIRKMEDLWKILGPVRLFSLQIHSNYYNFESLWFYENNG